MSCWQPQQAWIDPQPGIIQVWRLAPSQWEYRRQDHWQILSDAERERAQRFRFERDQLRHITSRASLRILLAKATGVAPQALRFGENDFGKPLLEPQPSKLTFNTSHSSDLVVHAIGSRQDVGIDVEQIRDAGNLQGIANFFSPQEITELQSKSVSPDPADFFALWTRKEAYIKGLGLGLSKPLNSFAMVADSMQKPALRFDIDNPKAAQIWEFRQIDADPDYAGTLAVQGKIKELQCWDFSP